jgi:hypothetical protein
LARLRYQALVTGIRIFAYECMERALYGSIIRELDGVAFILEDPSD